MPLTLSRGYQNVVAGFGDEIGRAPMLDEFLEILGWAIPSGSGVLDGTFAEPLKLRPVVAGQRETYKGSPPSSQVPELNDNVFMEATEQNHILVTKLIKSGRGLNQNNQVLPQQFALAILQILQTGKIPLDDIKSENILSINVDLSGSGSGRKSTASTLEKGDILAIPLRQGQDGFRFAVILARNRFGTALGFLHGVFSNAQLDPKSTPAPTKFPIYTGEGLVGNKDTGSKAAWRIAGHDEMLLTRFPACPEIYHRPGAWANVGIDMGEFGAAETDHATLRFIDQLEAREVGLLDGIYRQIYQPEHLQNLLESRAADWP